MKLKSKVLAKHKEEATAPAKEVLDHVYQALLRTPEFTLADGTKARVDAYYAPELDDEEELKCGFDVLLDNGTHLEFTVRNSGWGKSFVAGLAGPKSKKGRQR